MCEKVELVLLTSRALSSNLVYIMCECVYVSEIRENVVYRNIELTRSNEHEHAIV